MELKGKVAVVTGVASGIGRAMACKWAAEGMRVAIADIDEEGLRSLEQELADAGSEVLAQPLNVADKPAVDAFADAVFTRFGAVDLLCNNAGVLGVDGNPLWLVERREWDRAFDVNFFGVVHGLQAFLPRMIAQGTPAHVLTTASMSAFSAGPILPCYIASKHALMAVCESLRLQLEQAGGTVTSSVLVPGYTRTSLVAREKQASAGGEDAAFDDIIARGSVPQEAMEPEETAEIVAEAIRKGEFWIFPNTLSRGRIEARIGPIIAAARP